MLIAYLWMTITMNILTIKERTQLSQYSLMKDPSNYADSYWMGYHAFGLADKMGSLSQILEASYTKSLMEAIPSNLVFTMSEYDDKWRKHCNHMLHSH